jgi:hypothetical protein
MAAGLGFKTFNTGDVLSAADVNGYLMQGVLVFAGATARDAAITSPQEGQFAFLKDTNVTTYYTGSAWANLDTTGMTNPMTTTGDTIYSSSGSTPARLGIGTAGQVLQVNSGATAPEWATPAGGGGKVLQVVQASSNTETSVAGTTYGDTTLSATITPSATNSKILVFVSQQLRSRNDTATGTFSGLRLVRGATTIFTPGTATFTFAGITTFSTNDISFYSIANFHYLDSPSTTSATTYKTQAANSSGSGTSLAITQQSSAVSVITLMEIGA